MKTKFFSLLLALTMGVGTIAASDIKINDIWYDLDEVSQTAVVTYKGDAPDWDNRYTGRVVIPAKVQDENKTKYDVIAIGEGAFRYCNKLTEVSLPNSITSIGTRAFSGCWALTKITLPEGVTTIGQYAFSACYDLTKVNIPASVTTIEKCAFNVCRSLLNVEVPATVTSIATDAFLHTPNVIYNGTDSYVPWGAQCFNGVVDGNLVYSNNEKTSLLACSHAAKGTLNLPSTITHIGPYAFYMCTDLDSLRLPSSVKTVESYAFQECTAMISLIVPNTVTTVASQAFYLVPNVIYEGSMSYSNWGAKNVNGYVDGNLVYADEEHTILSAVSSKIKGQLNIPNSVKTIKQSAFDAQLAEVEFPMLGSSVETIGSYAFYNCTKVTKFVLPPTVKTIGSSAFYYCTGLKTFVCEATTPPTCAGDLFKKAQGIVMTHRIYVPEESLTAYKTASVWSTYKDSIFPITAENVKVSDSKIIVDPVTDISATIKWPKRDEAVTYTVKIELEEVAKQTYVFNGVGQLANAAFGAPGKDGDTRGVVTAARAIADGWIYTFEGLEPNTNYKAIVKAEDASSVELYEYSTTFKTLKRQAIDQVSSDKVQCTKELRDGQLLIRRGDKTYTVSGQVIE